MSNSSFDVWMCPEPWQYPGVCHPIYLLDLTVAENNGNVEVTVPLCPSGYRCDALEVTVYLLPEDKTERDCLYCLPACESAAVEEPWRNTLLERHNEARVTHPDECFPDCHELSESGGLQTMAQWFADDMIIGDYYADDHVDRWGRDLSKRMHIFNIPYIVAGENIGEIITDDEDLSDEEVATRLFDAWMVSKGHRANIMNPSYQKVGFGLSRKIWLDGDTVKRRWVGVCDFSDQDQREVSFPQPVHTCASECAEQITWWQEYEEHTRWTSAGSTETVRVAKPFLRTSVTIPPFCGLKRLRFELEESPCAAVWEPQANLTEPQQEIEDSGIKLIWSDILGDKWVLRWHLSGSVCWLPGEYMAVWAYFGDDDACEPFLIGYGWFETQCWTSGIVKGCGLYSGGGFTEGGLGYELNDDWVGNTDLRYIIEYKGTNYVLKCTDFARYALNERAFIFKGGYSEAKALSGDILRAHGCRWPYNMAWVGEVLDSSNVSYQLDPANDVIVPQHFWGVGA